MCSALLHVRFTPESGQLAGTDWTANYFPPRFILHLFGHSPIQ